MRTVGALWRESKSQLSLSYVGIESPTPIYLNEQLTKTKTNYEIFKAVMQMKRQKTLSAVFTRRATVHVKKTGSDEVLCVENMKALNDINPDLHKTPAETDSTKDGAT